MLGGFFMTTKNTEEKKRTRNYAFLVYPESAPPNWMEILSDTHCPAFVSPLHDRDINPDGELKKAHYHVMLLFDGVKSSDQAQAIRDAVGGVGWEQIASQRGYIRYLCHLDNPEKHQYRKEDVKAFGGLNYFAMVSLPTDIDAIIDDMTRYIDANQVFSFRTFAAYCRDYNPDWSYALKHSASYYIKEYIKGLAWDTISTDAQLLKEIRKQAGLGDLK